MNLNNKKECKDYLRNSFSSIKEMCQSYGIPEYIFRNRTKLGWSLEKILTTPVNNQFIDHLGKEYKNLDEMLNAHNITKAVYYTRKKKGWDLERIFTTPSKQMRVDHTGEKNINSQGYEMEIISSPDAHHLTVRFTDDGFIRTGVYYTDFKRGLVRKNASQKNQRETRIGEKFTLKTGKVATIIEYFDATNVTIEVDGEIFKKIQYAKLKDGNYSVGEYVINKDKFIGKENLTQDGEKFTIIKDLGDTAIVEINSIQKEYSWRAINQGCIVSSARQKSHYQNIYKKGYTSKTANGENFTILKAINKSYCMIQYDDGITEKVTYSNIGKGTLIRRDPGKKIPNKYGLDITIINSKLDNNGKWVYKVSVNGLALKGYRPLDNLKKRKYATDNYIKKELVKSVYGERYKTSYGTDIEIIGGPTKSNLTIKYLDTGIVRKHCEYIKIKRNEIGAPSGISGITRQMKTKVLKEGLTRISVSGLHGTISEYRSSQDVTVYIKETNEYIKTSSFNFEHGLFYSTLESSMSRTSVNEYTILYALKDAGFIKAPGRMLKEMGYEDLSGFEFDIFNPEKKIAIEYDGGLHKNKKDTDIRKDILANKYGIHIIRIREPEAGILKDGIAKEFHIVDAHYFSPAIRNVLRDLKVYLEEYTGEHIHIKDITKHKKTILLNLQNNGKFSSHLGEKTKNKDGYEMEIVKYETRNKFTIRFENGFEREYRDYYEAFILGHAKMMETHHGEKFSTKAGDEATIISKRYGSRVDIQFEDGTIIENMQYSQLTNKNFSHPNKKELYFKKKEGTTAIHKFTGLKMKAVNIRKDSENYKGTAALRCDVEFEDGKKAFNKSYSHFKTGNVAYPVDQVLEINNEELEM